MTELLLQILLAASWRIRPYETGWSGILQLRDHFGIPGEGEIISNSSREAMYFYSY